MARSEFDSSFGGFRFAGLVALLIVLTYPDVFFGHRTFVFRDYGFFSYPLAYWSRESFWRGELPLWNPESSCGIPFLAQWNTMVCYPLALIYLLLPLPWSLGFFTLFHWFLGALGMYCLANARVQHRFAAGVAAVAYAFNGLTINCLMWPHVTAALGWMPWVVAAGLQAWKRGGRSLVIAAVLGAFQMLTGAVELILFTWLLVIALCLLNENVRSVSVLKSGRRPGLVILLVTGLAAMQLLPFFELLRHSNRNASYLSTESALPLYGWADFLVPIFRAARSPVGIFYQPDQFWTTSYYLNLTVLALAAFAIWRSRNVQIRWLAVGIGISTLLALGDPGYLYPALRKVVPGFNLVNFPVKYLLVVPFLISLIAARGVRELRTSHSNPDLQRSLKIVVVVMIALIAGILTYDRMSPRPYESWPAMCWNAIARIAFLVGGIALLRLCTKGRVANAGLRSAAALGVLLILWIDVTTHTPQQNPTVDNLAFQPGLQHLAQNPAKPDSAIGRLMLSGEARLQSDRVTLADPLYDYLGHRLSQTMNCNLLDGFAKVDGFYPLYVNEHLDIIRVLNGLTNSESSPLADFLSVSHVSTPGNPREFSPRASFAPIVTAGQTPVFADKLTTLRGLASRQFDPGKIVYLPLDIEKAVTTTNRSDAVVVSSRIQPHQLRIRVNARQPCLLVVAQTDYPLWRAEVNGRPTRIWRANHAFQAIELPAGNCEVAITYRDHIFILGLLLSMLSLCASFVAWCRIGTESTDRIRAGV